MKEQIAAFQNALDAFGKYAGLLSAAATAFRAGDRSEDLIVSLMRSNTDEISPDTAQGLLKGAQSASESIPFLTALLAKAEVVQAISSTLTHARSLDRELEMVLDLQSPPFARVPPPYRFFDKVEDQLLTAFPRDLDDPVDTPQRRQFQRYLETVENPWRK